MQNSLVPQRRIQVGYVTVTKVRGYSCAAEVPVVSVSAGTPYATKTLVNA